MDGGKRPKGKSEDQGKGKGKEVTEQRQHEPISSSKPASSGSPSMTSRLASSASALSSSMSSGPPAITDLARLASGEKGEASASGALDRTTGAWAQGESSTHQGFCPAGTSAAFKSTQTEDHIARDEASFSEFLDNASVFQPTGPSETLAEGLLIEAALPGRPVAQSVAQSVAAHESRDGAAVAAILSRNDEDYEPVDLHGFLSADEAEKLKRAIFGGGSEGTAATRLDHVLNFMPEFIRGQPDLDKRDEARSYMGADDFQESREQWTTQWHDVLASYTEAVWGDLQPLVKEAKRELEELDQAPQDGPVLETPAVRRLRMILLQLRGY